VKITDSPSPNFGNRPAGARPRLIVIHATVGTDAGDLEWLRSPTSGVSYHYLVQRTGAIHRLVHPERRAWHAGDSVWRGVRDVNDYSIGIGLSNLGGGEPYTEAQYGAAGWLCSVFKREFGIGFEQIVGHYHVSPGRKKDPFESFEWGRLFARMTTLAL
jgi:N-acetylmuramoyl-L-alanine amidase